jgi:hypothetical protein
LLQNPGLNPWIDADRLRWRVADLQIPLLFFACRFAQEKCKFLNFSLDYFILLDIVDYDMIASTFPQPWLFYSPLAQQAVFLKDDLLDPVDQLLDDPALVELVRQCLAKRKPLSTRTGRDGIAPDRLLLRQFPLAHTI